MKELPKLVLNRDYVLTTTKGHVIAFKKHDECSDAACEIQLEQRRAQPVTWAGSAG